MPRTYAAVTPYRASITREPFLFYEMRATARLLYHNVTDQAAVEQIIRENLFQYPTEKSVRRMARACVIRLRNMHDDMEGVCLGLLSYGWFLPSVSFGIC